eukprot:UN03005
MEPIPNKNNRKYLVLSNSCIHVTLHALVELLIAGRNVIHLDLTNVDFNKCAQNSIDKHKNFNMLPNRNNFLHEMFGKVFFEERNGGEEWEKKRQVWRKENI